MRKDTNDRILLTAARNVARRDPRFREALRGELKGRSVKAGALDAADFARHVSAHLLNDGGFRQRTEAWMRAWFKQQGIPATDQMVEASARDMLRWGVRFDDERIALNLASLARDYRTLLDI